jgi:hypothetical protein
LVNRTLTVLLIEDVGNEIKDEEDDDDDVGLQK